MHKSEVAGGFGGIFWRHPSWKISLLLFFFFAECWSIKMIIFLESWNCIKNRNNMKENHLLHARVSCLEMFCWKCRNTFKSCETLLKSPAGKKYRILIGLCNSVFINFPIVFLDWNKKKTKLVLGSFTNFMKKTYKKAHKEFSLLSVMEKNKCLATEC